MAFRPIRGHKRYTQATMNRREFSKSLLTLWPTLGSTQTPTSEAVDVNDIHSRLNATRVSSVERVTSTEQLAEVVSSARRQGQNISIAGGRHAMGGQQFGADTVLVDTVQMNRVLRLDSDKGLIEVQAGIEWPALIEYLIKAGEDRSNAWGIRQKQTGADRLTMGGALSANAHGRGLRMRPFIGDVESFVLIDADGKPRRCSRDENAQLFKLAIGGYGLFGPISSVTLRLDPRRKLERVVEVIRIDDLMAMFEKRMDAGFLYGDFQYDIDPKSEYFLRRGVFSCYRPLAASTPIPEKQKELSDQQWIQLLDLAHNDKSRAFERYSSYYLSTSGQIYWSDTHQLSFYPEGYHRALDQRLGASNPATEMITEIYVPRTGLAGFMTEAAADFRKSDVNVIYGTIRLIERDGESFLQWARQAYACVIFNLHVVHTPEGLQRAAEAFRRLIDMAIRRDGSYYLTYHRWATRRQVEACYPQFQEFLRLKKEHDPAERFQSDWYRHYKQMFA
ncbi:MAG TPA: FAD-binding oxidoreductase [Bryobacteraceae bacterium]|nr:FAD-binding oxidoreductase [Bryobacteraceae bacterium]